MTNPISLTELVKNGELSEEARARMAGYGITNTNELYVRVRQAVRGSDEMRRTLERELGISAERFSGYLEFLKPYVSESILDDSNLPRHPLGVPIFTRGRGK